MNMKLEAYRRALPGIPPILFRHVFILVNAVIFAVVGLLVYFNETQAGVFLGIIVTVNIILGFSQDFRARVSLEELQLLTALHVTRIHDDGSEEVILAEVAEKGERIRLRQGDQVPCDGVLLASQGFEVSEALITGESDSFPKAVGDTVLAGNIVTAGVGEMRVDRVFAESRIAKMTEDIKRYSLNPSPIQRAIDVVIAYSGGALIAVLVFVVARGTYLGLPPIKIVNDVGALASTLVPQGLVVVTTLLFAFGAASYSKRNVLFQEINATEKFGRIKNLCMDKTGTLTDNTLRVETVYLPGGGSRENAERLTSAYLEGSRDASQTVNAVKESLRTPFHGVIGKVQSFSSWRQYGAVALPEVDDGTIVFAGAPDILLPHIANEGEREHFAAFLKGHTDAGRRVFAVFGAKGTEPPPSLDGVDLFVICAYVFASDFRAGAEEAVRFFQRRGVRIRVISGDNLATVRSVAEKAGIDRFERSISGAELESWSDDDYAKRAADYTIFARVKPEQKVKIIEALKRNGFTAMIGDGANDALALKRSDLGIAMFDGAAATRQLAAVVLMNNSFTALPGAARLADNFIRNIEIFASIFIYPAFVGFFFFLFLSAIGHLYPLTPLNVTLMNYIMVGLPGTLISYWSLLPSGNVPKPSARPFLSRVIPYTLASSLLGACGAIAAYLSSSEAMRASESNTIVLIAMSAFGFLFFANAPWIFRGWVARREFVHLAIMAVVDVLILYGAYHWDRAVSFFTLNPDLPSGTEAVALVAIISLYALAQGYVTYRYRKQEWSAPLPSEHQRFFSIIVPAHNEEKYIGETLRHLADLEYPQDQYEVIVIENASNDRTLEIAEAFRSPNIFVHTIPDKGVSRAKNFAMERVSSRSEWIVFLDADTHLLRDFLSDLDQFLDAHRNEPLSVGTTALRPIENQSLKARLWFLFYDWGHATFHVSYALQIMNAKFRDQVRFDEKRRYAEDLALIKDLKRYGKFFFLPTENAMTSTRRFEKVGWFKLFLLWNWDALVSAKLERKKSDAYDVVR